MRRRNIVTITVMLWSYISSMDVSPYGTGLVGHEISLQVLLGWSLICPTIPCIRPLAMRFTTGGAVVLAGEFRNTGDAPSTTMSNTDSRGLRKRHSQFPRDSQQQEHDEIELGPNAADRIVPIAEAGGDDTAHDAVESCAAGHNGIHVSRQYEVFIEKTKNKSETRYMPYSMPSVSEDAL